MDYKHPVYRWMNLDEWLEWSHGRHPDIAETLLVRSFYVLATLKDDDGQDRSMKHPDTGEVSVKVLM